MKLEIFYNDSCPTCVRIARMIKSFDTKRNIGLSPISGCEWFLQYNDIDIDDAIKNIHAVDDQGDVKVGYDVFLAILTATGWPRLATLLGFFPLYYLGVAAYKVVNFLK